MDGAPERTAQRYRQANKLKPNGRKGTAKTPDNKLSEQKRTDINNTANQQKFAELPPSLIVPTLADAGKYLAAESTFYWVLCEKDQLTRRGKAKPAVNEHPEAIQVTDPNQLWSWTYRICPPLAKDCVYTST